MSQRSSAVAAAAAAIVVVACGGCFVLDRADGLAPGTVRGRAVVDGAAVDVSAVVSGTAAVDSDGGVFVVGGLPVGEFALRLSSDEDGDGDVDRGAALRFVVPAQRDGAPAGVDLGDIDVGGVFFVSGAVVDGDGGGLAGAHVVAYRRAVDASVEADVGVVGGAYSIGVVGGDVSVVAFADGGRQSQVVDLALDGDARDVVLTVIDADEAQVSGAVTPALPGARVDAVGGGAVVASGNAGVFFGVDAGVYDAVFHDDGAIVGFLPAQIALAGAQTTWGPAVVGCGGACDVDVEGGEGEGEAGEGEGEGEAGEGEGEAPNTPPTVDTARALRRVLLDGSDTVVVVNAADADGDAVGVSYTLVPDDGTLLVTVQGNEAHVALSAPQTGALTTAALHAIADDGTDTSDTVVADLVVADAVFTGAAADGGLSTNPTNWLDNALPGVGVGAVVVIDADCDTQAELPPPSWGTLQVRSGLLNNDAIAIAGDLVIDDGASAFFDGLSTVLGDARVAGTSLGTLTFSGATNHVVAGNLGSVVVEGGDTVTLDPTVDVNVFDLDIDGVVAVNGGRLAIDGDLTINGDGAGPGSDGALGGADGIVHFLGNNVVIDGVLDLSATAGFSFGFIGVDLGRVATVSGVNAGNANWSNLFVFSDNAAVTINPGVPVIVTNLAVGDNATLATNDSRLVVNGTVDVDAGATVVADLVEYNAADIVADGVIGGVDVGLGESKRLLGNATTRTPSTLAGLLVVGDGAPATVDFSALTIDASGRLGLAPAATVTVTNNFQSAGGNLDMGAGSVLVLREPSDFRLGSTNIDGSARIVVGNGGAGDLTWLDGGAPLTLGDLEVRDNENVIVDADLIVDELTVGQNALVLVNAGSLTVNSCVNNGGSVTFGVCP